MPVAVPYYVPIRAPRGRLVHAVADIATAGRTVCGRSCSGWRVALARRARKAYPRALGHEVEFGAVLTCGECRRALGLPPLHRAASRSRGPR